MEKQALNNEPLISVIVPVYNSGGYLLPCIRSILDNTYKNIELICVDDGSTDASPQILKFQSSIDPRVKIITQKNLGPAAARNAGLDNAKGEFIAFVDSDDYIEWNAFEKLVANVNETQADIVVFGGESFPKDIEAPEWITEKLTSSDMVCDWSTAGVDVLLRENNTKPFIWLHFIRRSLFEMQPKIRFDTAFDLGEDQIAIFSYFPKAKIVSFMSDKLYHYRLNHGGSLMDKYNSLKTTKFETHIQIMGEVLKHWHEFGYKDVSGECMSHFINFLMPDFERMPEYKKIRYAKKIISVIEDAGWNIFICREWSYDSAKKISDYANVEEVDLISTLNNQALEVEVINNEIKAILSSKTYRLGKSLTKKSKRIDEKWLMGQDEAIF